MQRLINKIARRVAGVLGWEGGALPSPEETVANSDRLRQLRLPQFYCKSCNRATRMLDCEIDLIQLDCGHALQFDSDTGVWE